jgi:hypothetical protein
MLALNKSVVYNEATSVCEATEFDATTMTYWVLWGLPMDARELSKRTGSTPSVSFPFDRATYPSYAWGDHDDDSLSAQVRKTWKRHFFSPINCIVRYMRRSFFCSVLLHVGTTL